MKKNEFENFILLSIKNIFKMPRSLKKSPFVAYHLLKKINQMNQAGKKDLLCNC